MALACALMPLLAASCGGSDGENGGQGGGHADESPSGLAAPTDFTATLIGDAGALVRITWVAGSGSPNMFMVMRVEEAASATETWQVPATVTTYEDSTVESGNTYRYMVHAMRGEEVSEPSNMVTVTIP